MLHCMQRAMVMAVLLSLSMLVHAGQAPRPNIIFILADDYSIDNVGCYGAETFLQATPNLDRLATEGMRFSQVYCHPKCGPTRISLQTGQYPFRHGSLGVTDKAGVRSVKDERPLLAEILGSAGYVTGTFGKSERDGFDEYLDTGNGADYYREQLAHHTGTLDYAQPVYSQDEIMHYALDFIERHRAGPFYCYIPLNLPHVPFDPPPFLLHQVDFPWITADDTLDLAGYQAANPGKTVDDLRQAAVDAVAGEDVYGAMNTMIDSYVGDVLAKLQELDIDQNTLVLFAGDNGSLGQRSDVWDPQTASYRPIDGGKDNYGDCGGRVPFLLRWPAEVIGGDVPTHLLDFTDLVPTFAGLAGASLPNDKTFDGHSFAPFLLAQPYTPREFVFVQRGPIYWIRNQGYRMDYDGRFYDLADAPFSKRWLDPNHLSSTETAARDRLDHLLNEVLDPRHGINYEAASDLWMENAHWTWKEQYWRNYYDVGITAISGDAADPDADGWPNLFEMAFSSVPIDAASVPALSAAQVSALEPGENASSSPHVVVERVAAMGDPAWGVAYTSLDDAGSTLWLRARRSGGEQAVLANDGARGSYSLADTPPTVPVDVDAADSIVAMPQVAGASLGITAAATDFEGEPVSYLLQADGDGRFAIDAASGVLSAARDLTASDSGEHQVQIAASDGSMTSDAASFSITLYEPSELSFAAVPVSHEEIHLSWSDEPLAQWYLLQRHMQAQANRLMIILLENDAEDHYRDRHLQPQQDYSYRLDAGRD